MARPHRIVPGPGRPRRYPDKERVQLNVRLTLPEMEKLRELAAAENMTASEYVRYTALVIKGTHQALSAGDVTVGELYKRESPGQLRIEGT